MILSRSDLKSPHAIMLTTSFIVTFFLFFIDEGYYDLRWMKSVGNWIMFFIYAGFAFSAQFLFSLISPRFLKPSAASWISAIFGTILGTGLLIFILS